VGGPAIGGVRDVHTQHVCVFFFGLPLQFDNFEQVTTLIISKRQVNQNAWYEFYLCFFL
jgi:hypothetical protein